jgi:hypothetical protein
LSAPRAGTFARTGQFQKVRTAARFEARLATMRCFLGDGAPVKCGRRPIQEIQMQKTRGRFPGAGFCNSCDDEDMSVICPTCQTFLKTAADLAADASSQTPAPVARIFRRRPLRQVLRPAAASP